MTLPRRIAATLLATAALTASAVPAHASLVEAPVWNVKGASVIVTGAAGTKTIYQGHSYTRATTAEPRYDTRCTEVKSYSVRTSTYSHVGWFRWKADRKKATQGYGIGFYAVSKCPSAPWISTILG